MVSVTDARRLLGPDCAASDDEVKVMLVQLRRIAHVALDTVEAERARGGSTIEREP